MMPGGAGACCPESGIATEDDSRRGAFMEKAVDGLGECMAESISQPTSQWQAGNFLTMAEKIHKGRDFYVIMFIISGNSP